MAYRPTPSAAAVPATRCGCQQHSAAGLGFLPANPQGLSIPSWATDWRVWAAVLAGLGLLIWVTRSSGSKTARQGKKRSATARARARYQSEIAKIEGRYAA